jgi:hypothetical protein
LRALGSAHVGDQETQIIDALTHSLPFSLAADPAEAVAQLRPLRDVLLRGTLSERKLAQMSGQWAVIP